MSYCECDYDDNPPRFFSATVVKSARTQHKCCECNGPIMPGETYTRRSGSWYPGEIDTYCECHLCMELRDWAKISMPCFCCNIFGDLHDKVREMVGDVAPKTPGFFVEYGRRMVKIRQRGALPST